ncbi:MAG: exo-alpha-sialidase [Aureliella sp.]
MKPAKFATGSLALALVASACFASGPIAEPKFDGFVSAGFVFEKAPFPQCHASTVCQTDAGLAAAWFGGTREKNPDVGIWTSYHNGTKWSAPVEAANGIQHSGLRYPCWNPVLFQIPSGPTMLFFKVGPNPRQWWGEVIFSHDGGRTFQDRRRLPEGIDGPVRCKPLLLKDGTLLCPSSTEIENDWRFHMELLTDLAHPELGTSWQRIEPEKQPFQVIQPTFLVGRDAGLTALMRSKHEQIAQSVSTDNGKTWSELKLINLPNNNSGIESLTLRDGRYLLLYNHTGGRKSSKEGWGRRNILNLAISSDGQKWQAAGTVEREDDGEFSYPAMIQTRDGKVHMTYTWNRKRVKHVIVEPSKLKPGRTLSIHDWDAK